MIILGKIGNTAVALRYKYDPANPHYETRVLPRGMLKRLTGKYPCYLHEVVRYNGYYEKEFDKLEIYYD